MQILGVGENDSRQEEGFGIEARLTVSGIRS